MFKKILVPLAFSGYSQGILRFATQLAKPLGAELLVVNVVNERDLEAVEKISSFGFKVDSDHYIQTIQDERVAELEKILAQMDFPEEKLTFKFVVGDPATELLRFVIDKEIDMVVMGVKTRDIRHIFTGSVAERLFRRSPVTIVSYRDKEIADRLRKRVIRHLDRHEKSH